MEGVEVLVIDLFVALVEVDHPVSGLPGHFAFPFCRHVGGFFRLSDSSSASGSSSGRCSEWTPSWTADNRSIQAGSRGSSSRAKKSRGRLQDLVGAAQLLVTTRSPWLLIFYTQGLRERHRAPLRKQRSTPNAPAQNFAPRWAPLDTIAPPPVTPRWPRWPRESLENPRVS